MAPVALAAVLSVLLACVLAALFPPMPGVNQTNVLITFVYVLTCLMSLMAVFDGGQVHVQPFFFRLQQELLNIINAACHSILSAFKLSLQSLVVN